MFDRLIVSEPEGTQIHSRRNFFLVSTIVVAALALSAVVYDIFAQELSLGTDSFELTVLVAPPVDMPAERPEPPRPRLPATNTPTASASQVPMRQTNQSRVDEPTVVPHSTSTEANAQPSRPNVSRFDIGPLNSEPSIPSGPGRDIGSTGNGPSGLTSVEPAAERTADVEPPPVKTTPNVPAIVSRGVVNGTATYLPKPAYPATALAVRAMGKVDVQVLIDESGKVVSAKAISGNPLLRDAAERAARTARFTPTKLSDVPVKVTGVIVFNFSIS